MVTYSTLEEIKKDAQTNPSSNSLIVLRSEQRDAIDQAKEHFCKRNGRKGNYQYTVLPESRQFLWNAKMRFGKTVCAMQLMRELNPYYYTPSCGWRQLAQCFPSGCGHQGFSS